MLINHLPTGDVARAVPAAPRASRQRRAAHRRAPGGPSMALLGLLALLGACASKPPAAPAAGAGAAAAPAATPTASGAATSAAGTGAAAAAAAPLVVEPQVARRDLKLPTYPSRDFDIGLFTGTYSTQNFGTGSVSGIRLGYHITEDFFVNLQYGQTKVSDDSFRQILPGGVFVNRSETLKYYTLSMGYNLLPGEVFFGKGTAKLSQGYILAGAGTTDFAGQ
ncbi:MAG: outer membrane beta-barrel domain-containing protein, partial [Rubrivivax sp.]|nr:outer membrane beta-barrel domain-containing protein [Rubrivivax sp.]